MAALGLVVIVASPQPAPAPRSLCFNCSHLNTTTLFESCALAAAERIDPCARSATCVAKGGSSSIYIKHMRKAGGTTVKGTISSRICDKYIRGLEPGPKSKGMPPCNRHNADVSLWAEENSVLTQKHMKPLYELAEQSSSLWVTFLRDPLSRILSSYHFEGGPNFHQLGSDLKKKKKLQSISNGCPLGPECTLEAWINFMLKSPCASSTLWNSVNEYYVRRLSGSGNIACSKTGGAVNISESDYRTAVEKLLLFDVVFISEIMHGDKAAPLWQAVLPPLNCTGARTNEPPIPRGKANVNQMKNTSLAPLSIEALKEEAPLIFGHLERLNVWDRRLYDFATRLSSVQSRAWSKSLSDLSSCNTPCWHNGSRLASIPPRPMPMKLAPFWNRPESGPLYGCSGTVHIDRRGVSDRGPSLATGDLT